MEPVNQKLAAAAVLRGRAERQLEAPEGFFPLADGVTQKLLRELEVYKIELEIQNEELIATCSKAEERAHNLEVALKELESFSYAVSHDLRAPLRHINSYLAIMEEDYAEALPSGARTLLDQTRKATRQMSHLIDDLLELSRVTRVEVTPTAFNMSNLARDISEKLQAEEPGRRVTFNIHRGLRVRGDKHLICQMLWNLMENAWKYTSTSKDACIEVGSRTVNGQHIFFVKDNGVGFDDRYEQKIYQAFQRLHGPEFEGNGIGLATVKRIVDRHRGRIWAEAAVDRGATFYFTLPPAVALPPSNSTLPPPLIG